ncbi:gp107 [Synechococcus phage syn9]|jgi:hypothetical protein|uniref:Gp107 n=1 Tax=Synechococcus phage syn9 TaxID=382359 RepID=Q0QZC1_BPSYS|nr:gp107 [Synechococcus phage syn9]ABA47076.1 gp107 [Synechococcus phage syn9]AGH56565.1 hypothetical protein CPUG_00073 [Cyanophage Syn10]
MAIEKVSQAEMAQSFKTRYESLIEENKKLAAKIKENEITALKLQGALETLEYLAQDDETMSHPPDEVDEVDAE